MDRAVVPTGQRATGCVEWALALRPGAQHEEHGASGSNPPEEVGGVSVQGVGQVSDNHQAGVSASGLDTPQISHVNIGSFGELFLGQLPCFSEPPDVRSHDEPPILHGVGD